MKNNIEIMSKKVSNIVIASTLLLISGIVLYVFIRSTSTPESVVAPIQQPIGQTENTGFDLASLEEFEEDSYVGDMSKPIIPLKDVTISNDSEEVVVSFKSVPDQPLRNPPYYVLVNGKQLNETTYGQAILSSKFSEDEKFVFFQTLNSCGAYCYNVSNFVIDLETNNLHQINLAPFEDDKKLAAKFAYVGTVPVKIDFQDEKLLISIVTFGANTDGKAYILSSVTDKVFDLETMQFEQ